MPRQSFFKMPNRYVREAAIKSKAVNSLSWQGEVFWRRLLNLVDDFGRYPADPDVLRADVFPRQLERVREADIPRLLAECEKAGLLFRFEADAKWFLVMNQWEQGRAKKSRYPEPDDGTRQRLQTFVYECLQMSPTPTPIPTPTPAPPTERESAGAAPVERPEAHYAEAVIPTWDELKKMAAMPNCGVPEADARKFFDHYNANNLWQNKHGRPVNVLNSLIVWHNRSKTMVNNGVAPTAKPLALPKEAPAREQVVAYAKEKWGATMQVGDWVNRFWSIWSAPNRQWQRNGRPIDWKIELTEQVNKWRGAPSI